MNAGSFCWPHSSFSLVHQPVVSTMAQDERDTTRLHELAAIVLDDALATCLIYYGLADTLHRLAELTHAEAYRLPILAAEAQVRAASPFVDPAGILVLPEP